MMDNNDDLKFELEYLLKLKQAMQEANWKTEQAICLADPDLLRDLGQVFKGRKEIVDVELIIDLDREPELPTDWRRLGHQTLGKRYKWDPVQLELYLSPEQQNGSRIRGDKLIRRLRDRRAPNACLLDHLRRHSERLPTTWRQWLRGNQQRTICFIGTKYTDHEGHECVRCLSLDLEGRLIWDRRKLKDYWDGNDIIVLMIP